MLRDAVIQRFEFTFEVARKTLKRYLEEYGLGQVDRMTNRQLFRLGYEQGLLRDAQAWLLYLQRRNLTGHIIQRANCDAGVRDRPAVSRRRAILAHAFGGEIAMTMPHLEPEYLTIVLEILRRHAPNAQAYVFGSRASDRAKSHSDLDLLLREAGPIDPYRFAALCADFEDSDLPFRVDVLDYYQTDADFLKRIAPQCIPLATLNSQFPIPNSQFPILNSQFSTLNQQPVTSNQ